MQKHTHWWIDEKGALGAGKEIVGTNLHMQGDKLDKYMNEHFSEMWAKTNVLGTGWVEIERMA